MPDPFEAKQMTRRQILMGLGIAGAISSVCACGGLSTLAYIAGRSMKQRNQSQSQIIVETNPPPPTPELEPPPIVSRAEWGAWPPDHEAENETGFYSEDNPEGWYIYPGELRDSYQTVIIHHSAFYEETDLRTMLEIQETHRLRRGWADIAYHFLVGRSGVIYEGRDWAVRGTHVEGYNTGSLGVCLLGNFVREHPTNEQAASTQRLLTWLAERLQLTHIASHRQFNPLTECPGDNLLPLIARFAAAADLRIGIDGYVPLNEQEASCGCCACNHE